MKNAVKAYFERNWNREDMTNPDEIPLRAHESLKRVYLTFFCAMLTATFGSILHLIWEAGGLFTVLSSVASLLCLYLTSPWSVKKRVLLLMIAAFSFGASIGIFTNYLFEIDQDIVVSILSAAAIGFGTFWFGALLSRLRAILYTGCLLHSHAFMLSWLVITSDMIFVGYTVQWTLKVYVTLFLAILATAFGSYLHLIWETGGMLSIIKCGSSLLLLYRTPQQRVLARLLYLMDVAICFGASVGLFTKYFFEIDQSTVIRFLLGAAIVFGCFSIAAKVHRERSHIYITSLINTGILILLWFDVSQWTLKSYVLLALFMGYLVLYSQEILYDACFGEINFANCAFTIFFCLPAIVVHAIRLCLGANIEQHRQN